MVSAVGVERYNIHLLFTCAALVEHPQTRGQCGVLLWYVI